VVEMIRREAGRYGVAIHHSELVGLIPQEALVDAAVWYLQLDQFQPGQVLESRLAQALADQPVDFDPTAQAVQTAASDFLEALASPTATPGGGSAAAYAGAQAAALVAMVARLTVGKKKYAAVEAQMQSIAHQADALRSEFTQAVMQDSAAYAQVMEAYKLPKDTQAQQHGRTQAIEQAILGAIQPPLKVAQLAVRTLELAAIAISQGNLNAISDGGVAAALGRAALTGAGLNVRTNAAALKDKTPVQPILEILVELESQATHIEQTIQRTLAERSDLVSV